MRSYLVAAAICAIAISAPASAQSDEQQAAPSIVVEAPASLNEKQSREWDKLNREAAQLEKRLATLRSRILDDREEVTEAQRRVDRAQDKLEREQKDQARTLSRIEDAEKDRSKIEKSRIKLLSGE